MSGVIQMVLSVQGMFLSTPPPGVHVTSRTDCVSRCYWSRSCSSVFYSNSSLTCHLVNTVYLTSELQVSPDPSMKYWVWQSDHCGNDYTWRQDLNICYKLFTIRQSFDDAQAICVDEGGNLMKAHTTGRNTLLYQLAAITEGYTYIGARRDATNTLTWLDDTPVSMPLWDDYQPKNISLKCVYGSPTASARGTAMGWHDGDCSRSYPFICEKALPKCKPVV